MQSSVRTRRSNGSTNDATFESILKCFSNANSTKSIIKKISGDVAQLLLGHAFQVIVLSCTLLVWQTFIYISRVKLLVAGVMLLFTFLYAFIISMLLYAFIIYIATILP